MKKTLQIFVLFSFALSLSACDMLKSKLLGEKEQAQDTSQNKENGDDKSKSSKEDVENTKAVAPAAEAEGKIDRDEAPKAYSKIQGKGFPIPSDPEPIAYASEEASDSNDVVHYTYVNDFPTDKYKQQLKRAGFENVHGDIYYKKGANAPLLVGITEGEGEVVIIMSQTRDPDNRYENIPDRRIPYPLEKGAFAAEFATFTPPNEASNFSVYSYYPLSKNFVADYKKRLEKAGFVNTRTPESPLYVKQEADVELNVYIDIFENEASEVRVQMLVARIERD